LFAFLGLPVAGCEDKGAAKQRENKIATSTAETTVSYHFAPWISSYHRIDGGDAGVSPRQVAGSMPARQRARRPHYISPSSGHAYAISAP
jgi:hypothetical protein